MLVNIVKCLSLCSAHVTLRATDPRRERASERIFRFRDPINDLNVFVPVFYHLITGVSYMGSN
jgi:hypothetical protein